MLAARLIPAPTGFLDIDAVQHLRNGPQLPTVTHRNGIRPNHMDRIPFPRRPLRPQKGRRTENSGDRTEIPAGKNPSPTVLLERSTAKPLFEPEPVSPTAHQWRGGSGESQYLVFTLCEGVMRPRLDASDKERTVWGWRTALVRQPRRYRSAARPSQFARLTKSERSRCRRRRDGLHYGTPSRQSFFES